MNLTTLEQSRRLAALGMPQDGWYWYSEYGMVSDPPRVYTSYGPKPTNQFQTACYAATDYLTAFEYMASLGWRTNLRVVERRVDDYVCVGTLYRDDTRIADEVYADTPSALLDAMLTAQEGA